MKRGENRASATQAKLDGSLAKMTTKPFAALVERAKGKEYQMMHPAKMTFQALRIVVNREYLELKLGLEASLKVLAVGGAVSVLAWKHSEHAICVDFHVENAIASYDHPLKHWYGAYKASDAKRAKKCKCDPKAVGVLADDVKRPTDAEILKNSRVRSALLHVCRKATGLRVDDLQRTAAKCLKWDPHVKPKAPHERAAVKDAPDLA